MKRFLHLLFLLPLALNGQLFPGYHTDNYAGVHHLNFQPAEIVDSRYLFDFNLVGASFSAGNNYAALKRSALFKSDSWNDPNFQDNYMYEKLNGKPKTAYAQARALLPSFMFSFGKNAIAFSSKANVVVNVEGVNEELAYMIWRELDYSQWWNRSIQNQNFSVQAMGWMDYGMTYGREVLKHKRHYVKAAVTGKLLQGILSAQFYSHNIDVSFPNSDYINVNNSDVSYGHSNNFELDQDGLKYKFVGKPGLGFDFGAVYEFRKNNEDYTYEMDGRDDWERRDKNKYVLKLGFSVMDFGSIAFTKGGLSRSFYANTPNIPLDTFDKASVNYFDTLLNGYFQFKNDSGQVYRMDLPTSINFTADYNIWKGFYVNATASVAPRRKSDPNKLRHISQFTLTPRYESRFFGAYLPISIDALSNWHVGFGLRAGPLVVGTNDISPLLFKKNIYDVNVYVMLRVPISFGKGHWDKDGDKVSNKLDKCRKEPGTWENKGCPMPDKDGDGILDDLDRCPDVAGVANLLGCPDMDQDSVADLDDACPDIAGTVELNGCPDQDGDGVQDKYDDCPEVPGVKELKGCPDRDSDGIEDDRDECPDRPGTRAGMGCPDTDADGLYDNLDKCPEKAGPIVNGGCPEENVDTDKDGVLDRHDDCPKIPGPIDNKGCPWKDSDGDGLLDNF